MSYEKCDNKLSLLAIIFKYDFPIREFFDVSCIVVYKQKTIMNIVRVDDWTAEKA